MNKVKKMLYSQKVAPYVFVLPFVISLLVFWLYPLISGIVMSFQDISFGGSQWVGLKHYQKLASDKFFKTAVFNSVEYMLLTLLLLIPIPMMLAVLMESRLTKAKGVWKVIMYIPALTSVVISGMLFRLMFSEGDNGQMNQLMHLLGNASIPWLKAKTTGWIALLLLCIHEKATSVLLILLPSFTVIYHLVKDFSLCNIYYYSLALQMKLKDNS